MVTKTDTFPCCRHAYLNDEDRCINDGLDMTHPSTALQTIQER